MSSESYEAHWRAAANDSIPYGKDFPEWFTMTIELLNGGKKPTVVSQRLNFLKDKVQYRYRDNGYGCTLQDALNRLFQWASVSAVDGKSVYGHGTKKFLAKSGDYKTIKFAIRTRVQGEKKIIQWTSPYVGQKTHFDTVEIADFPEHGFEIELEISKEKLCENNTPIKAFDALKEIICARKDQSVISTVHFVVEVLQNGVPVKQEDSVMNQWKSFKETIATNTSCRLLLKKTIPFVEGKVNLEYESYTTGALTQIPGFPVYGKMTGGEGTRIHTSSEDTMIEAHSWYDLLGVRVHPSNWHRVDFARFVPLDPDDMEHIAALPEPATTKVQYRHESPKWQKFVTSVKDIYGSHKSELVLASKESLKSPILQGDNTIEGLQPMGRNSGRSSLASSPASGFFGMAQPVAAGAAAGSGTVREAVPRTVETITPHVFENTTLSDLYEKYRTEGKSPARYDLPSWLASGEPLLSYMENGKQYLIYYRQRQRGALSEDVEKAYVALSRYANEKKLTPDKITMIFCLHLKSAPKERVNEFETVKKRMLSTVYPFIGCLELKLMKDL